MTEATGFSQDYLTQVHITLNVEQAPPLSYYVVVHRLRKKDDPDEIPTIDGMPTLMYQHGDHVRFRRVVATAGCILEVFAAAGPDADPYAYGMYLIAADKAAPVEERGLHLTEDTQGSDSLPCVRDILYWFR